MARQLRLGFCKKARAPDSKLSTFRYVESKSSETASMQHILEILSIVHFWLFDFICVWFQVICTTWLVCIKHSTDLEVWGPTVVAAGLSWWFGSEVGCLSPRSGQAVRWCEMSRCRRHGSFKMFQVVQTQINTASQPEAFFYERPVQRASIQDCLRFTMGTYEYCCGVPHVCSHCLQKMPTKPRLLMLNSSSTYARTYSS